MKRIQKYIDEQARSLYFIQGETSYWISDVPDADYGNNWYYNVVARNQRTGERDIQYFITAKALAGAMKEISGDLRRWKVA